MRPYVWNNMFELIPENFTAWAAHRPVCPAPAPVLGEPIVDIDQPGLNENDADWTDRTLHFRIRVHGGEGCGCSPAMLEATARQRVRLDRAPGWPEPPTFLVPDPTPPS
jgi:hypothetical protein